MKRELDEIEAEMGKESMKYVCDHAGACERKPCYHEGKHEAVKACDPPRSGLKGCDHLHSKCIPVEPERVWCAYDRRPLSVPSWAARAGLLEREKKSAPRDDELDWFVVGRITKHKRLTKEQALEDAWSFYLKETTPGLDYRIFKWSDGVQG